jgi:hypothetical protein
VQRLVLFLRWYLSQPYFDIHSVPMVLDMSRNPGELSYPDTFFDIAPSLAILIGIRLGVVRVRASFGMTHVTVEERGKKWSVPIASYSGLTSRHFFTETYASPAPHTGNLPFHRSVYSGPAIADHRWIELVHRDPAKTLILAAEWNGGPMQDRLEKYSRALNRPIWPRARMSDPSKTPYALRRVIIGFPNGLAQFRFHVLRFFGRLAGGGAVPGVPRPPRAEDPAGAEPLEEYDR